MCLKFPFISVRFRHICKTALVYITCPISPWSTATWSLRHKINAAVPNCHYHMGENISLSINSAFRQIGKVSSPGYTVWPSIFPIFLAATWEVLTCHPHGSCLLQFGQMISCKTLYEKHLNSFFLSILVKLNKWHCITIEHKECRRKSNVQVSWQLSTS